MTASLIMAAAGAVAVSGEMGERNWTAIIMFFAFVAGTLGITYWAARRTRSADDFYAAGSRISGVQNGFAIAGDFMSAATFLGVSAFVYAAGFDGLIYAIGGTMGWPIILFLMADRLRNLGRYTFADIAAYRLERDRMRGLAAGGGLVVITLYLIAQMVGAGALIQVLFGLPYVTAVVLVGVLMTLYVSFGGMLATTWVQITKAVLLLLGGIFIAIAVLMVFDFSIESLFRSAIASHDKGISLMAPGSLLADPVTAFSVALAFMFGPAGLPHILMRFFTVPNAKEARKSVFVATGIVGFFQILVCILGLGAIAIISGRPEYFDGSGSLLGGVNMASVHLSHAVGGNLFLGFISAVAFATILAVVAGLTLAAASAVSHDLYANVIKKGQASEKQILRVAKITPAAVGLVAIMLGIAFQGENVAFMAVLAMSVAASVNFPVLILTMYWRGLTTRGALAGGLSGLVVAVTLVILSPVVWVSIFGFEQAIYPYAYPTIFSMTAAFGGAWIFSVTDKSARAKQEKTTFDRQYVHSLLGQPTAVIGDGVIDDKDPSGGP